jgi:hypothetical protein
VIFNYEFESRTSESLCIRGVVTSCTISSSEDADILIRIAVIHYMNTSETKHHNRTKQDDKLVQKISERKQKFRTTHRTTIWTNSDVTTLKITVRTSRTAQRSRCSDGIQDGRPGFDSRQGKKMFPFSIASRPALGRTQPLSDGYLGFFPRR